MQGKTMIVAIIAVVIGLIAGFSLRPLISPTASATTVAAPNPLASAPAAPRGTQYFAAHIDEARRVMSGCRDGSVRDEECANAEQALTEAEGRDRFKKFMGH